MSYPNGPEALTYGKMVGIFKTIEVDTASDVDNLPNHYPMSGTIRFTPSIPYNQLLLAGPGSTAFFKTSILASISEEGYLTSGEIDPETGKKEYGVTLLATDDPSLSTKNWTYNVQLTLKSYTGAPVSMPTNRDISVFGGEEMDLIKALTTPSSPGIGIPAMESAVLRAETAAQSVVDRANSGEFIGDTGPANTLEIGSVEFIPGSAIDSEVVDAQISTPGTVAHDALVAETRLAVLEKAGSFLMDPFSVGTVTTGAAGTTASATITGESPNRTLNLTLPKGDPGGWVVSHLGPGTDLNALTAPGVYSAGSSSYAKIENGFPIEAVCYVEVLSSGTTHVQRVTVAGGGSSMKVHYERRYNGSVWESWHTFNSTRVDNTAGRAIYQWDETANREQLIYGDTGWRALEFPDLIAGNYLVRRIGDTVTVQFDAGQFVSSGNIAFPRFPLNFRPTFRVRDTWMLDVSGGVGGTVNLSSGGYLNMYFYAVGVPAYFTLRFETSDAWPTTLPGTPA